MTLVWTVNNSSMMQAAERNPNGPISSS